MILKYTKEKSDYVGLLKKLNDLFNKMESGFSRHNNMPLKPEPIPNKIDIPILKKTNTDITGANLLIKKLTESYEIMKKTTDPCVFFKRLSFSYDCIINLMTYKIKFSKGCTPEDQYILLKNETETMVNDMIERTYSKESECASKLKTDKAKINRMTKYFEKMEEAFAKSDTYWVGWNFVSGHKLPHYKGELYTEANLKKLYDLKEAVFNSMNN